MSKNNKKARNAPYPYEAFVKHWAKANSISDVVAATGLTRNTVAALSSRLRKAGVKLKLMPRRTARPIDVKALNEVVKSATA